MSRLEVLSRLKAWEGGAPEPRGSSLPWPRTQDANRLVIAFVRMAGESLPWGVAIGKAGDEPTLFTATEPRDRDQTAELILGFGNVLLQYLRHPSTLDPALRQRFERDRPLLHAATDRLQVWLPGSSHVDMLHFIDFRYTIAASGDESRIHQLRTIGRACGWLFRESTRPGQVRVFDATARLRQSFSFPAEDPRQSHLGFLLAWLDKHSDRDAHLAGARAAEQHPSNVTMDPKYERDVLEPLLDAYKKARGKPEEGSVAVQVRDALAPELIRRWRQTVEAIRIFDADPRVSNPYLTQIEELGGSEYSEQFWDDEERAYDARLPLPDRRPRGNHPETDFLPTRAAHRYFMHLHAYELTNSELIHGDTMLLDQAIDAGSAFRGVVKTVVNLSKGKAIKAVWTLECAAKDSLRLREESAICIVGERKRKGKILRIENNESVRTITVEITKGVTGTSVSDDVDADDAAALVGRSVVWLDDHGGGAYRKTMKLGDNGPGAWLTHSTPAPELSPPAPVRADLLNFVESLR